MPACPPHLFCCPNQSSSSQWLQGSPVPELVTWGPWGCLGRGLPAWGARVLLEQLQPCRPWGEVGLESPSCKMECPAPHPRATGHWPHPSVLASLPSGEAMACPVPCCPPLTGGTQRPSSPLLQGCDCHGSGGDPSWFPQYPGTGLCPSLLRSISLAMQGGPCPCACHRLGQRDGARPTPKKQ